MSLTNPNSVVTEERLSEFFQQLRPFLGARPLITGGDTPIGAIEFFDDVDAPDNWVKADGSVLNIADYPFLASHYEQVHGSKNFYGGDGTTTFAVPDLQGEFLRGAGTNSHTNQGSGANVGVHQDGTKIGTIAGQSTDNIALWIDRNHQVLPNDLKTTVNADYVYDTSTSIYVATVGSSTSGATNVTHTTRPTNTSFLICIKAVPAGMNYSTEDQVVGTDTDGNPVWQKCIKNVVIPAGQSNLIATMTSQMSAMDCRYIRKKYNNVSGQLSCAPDSHVSFWSTDGINIYASNDQSYSYEGTLIVEYTKTS